jgi:hypothetical protein
MTPRIQIKSKPHFAGRPNAGGLDFHHAGLFGEGSGIQKVIIVLSGAEDLSFCRSK